MTYTPEQVIGALREVIAGHEDFVYRQPQCRYADESGNPSCVVGHAVNQLDPEVFAVIRQTEVNLGRSPSIGYSNEFREGEILGISNDGLLILQAAQAAQDGGETWGDALEIAEQYYEDLKLGVV